MVTVDENGGWDRHEWSRLLGLTLWVGLVSLGHFSLGIDTHREHLFHLLLAGFYLLPIEAAALWWGLRGGLAMSAGIGTIYLVHILTTWANHPMENANQVATIGVFLLLGTTSGLLVDRQNRERRLRAEEEARLQRQAVIQGLASLGNALRHRDESTLAHCERVAALAVRIGQALGLNAERLDRLRLAALIHDVGKIGIRDDILLKPEELTAEERHGIERHPAIAADILRPIRGAGEIAEIVLSHHENPDGSGYPRNLSGQQIPLESRILRVADVFIALTEERPYKPPMQTSEVLAWMESQAGSKLDGQSLDALRRALEPGG